MAAISQQLADSSLGSQKQRAAVNNRRKPLSSLTLQAELMSCMLPSTKGALRYELVSPTRMCDAGEQTPVTADHRARLTAPCFLRSAVGIEVVLGSTEVGITVAIAAALPWLCEHLAEEACAETMTSFLQVGASIWLEEVDRALDVDAAAIS